MSLGKDFWFSWDYSFRPDKPVSRKPISDGTRWRVFKRDKFRCVYCGASGSDAELVVDHLWPVARGGTNEEFNLAVSCAPCNRGKRDDYLGVLFTRYHRLGIFYRIYKENPHDRVSRAMWELGVELFGDVQCWLDGSAESKPLMDEYDRRLAEVDPEFGPETIQ